MRWNCSIIFICLINNSCNLLHFQLRYVCFEMSSCTNDFCVSSTGATAELFSSAIQYILTSQCLLTKDWPQSSEIKDFDQFHFIIVGGGSAGSVVANRLTENEKWNVLLIEAGEDPPIESFLPQMNGGLFQSKYDWGYKTVADGRTSRANINENVNWPRGKMLGGSSSMNGMIYLTGHSSDYQSWYDEGNREWHPAIVEKYFKKAESLQDQNLLNIPEINQVYGHHGPLVINTFNSTLRPISEKILSAFQEFGIKVVKDLKIANGTGASIFRATASNGKRKSTASAYINPIKKRNNFKILKNSLVTKILINDNLEAYGVEVITNGLTLTLLASMEVVLSAGSINTPQLLMLSGIGPKEHLESINITCIVNLPAVGQNLQDHLLIPIAIFGNETNFRNDVEPKDMLQYLMDTTGFLSQSTFVDITAFFSRSNKILRPEFQTHVQVFNINSSRGYGYFNSLYKTSIANTYKNESRNYSTFLFMFNLLHPYSRGNISMKSNNPHDHPLIYANYLRDSRDLAATAYGIKMLTKLIHSSYFKSINAFLFRYNWPECNIFKLDSVDYWKCISINMVTTVFHPVGTTKMGSCPHNSVVDSRLRVHKMKKLRVIDASIMPTITSGNTNGPTIMIGELGSDLIKEDYKEKC